MIYRAIKTLACFEFAIITTVFKCQTLGVIQKSQEQ